jgi:hypothetical protein
MATDGPDPPPCDREVFENGEMLFITYTIPSNAMEGWVKKVAQRSGQRVDWHFAGGRARVLALGDLDAVKKAIVELMPEHDELYMAAVRNLGEDSFKGMTITIPRPGWFTEYCSRQPRTSGKGGPKLLPK